MSMEQFKYNITIIPCTSLLPMVNLVTTQITLDNTTQTNYIIFFHPDCQQTTGVIHEIT